MTKRNAGSASIPQNAVVNLTLTEPGGRMFAVTLNSIPLNGQREMRWVRIEDVATPSS